MKDATQFHIRPARPEEAGLFYTPHPEEDKRLGTVGHVRMDFGRSGNEFWHTWWPRGPEELNSPTFKLELQEVVDTLRESVNSCKIWITTSASRRILPGVSALANTPKGGFLTRRRRKTVRLRRFEKKVALVKVKQALAAHFSKLQRQSAALHAEVIRKLLAGERNVELIAAPALRLGGKIGHQLCPRRALAHVGELFVEPQVLLRQFAQQVADDPAMVGAGGGAHAQNALYAQEHHRHRALRLHAYVQHRPRRAGKHLRKGLPRPGLGEDAAVSPDILLHDEDAARQHKAHLLHRVSGAEQAGAFGEGADPRPKAGEHSGKFLVGNAGEKRRRMEQRKKFFHKKSSLVENSTDLLILV